MKANNIKMKDRTDARALEAGKLRCRGFNRAQIAKELGVAQTTAYRYVQRWREIVARESKDTYDAWLGEQLTRIEEVESEAWQAWEKSKQQDALETGTEDTDSESSGKTSKVTTKRRKPIHGNPKFLDILMTSLHHRAQVLGLLDKDAQANARKEQDRTEDEAVVSIVVSDRDEVKELQSLSIEEYRSKVAAG